MTDLPLFAEQYAPYHLFPAFREGFEAYGRTWTCPYKGFKAQAWDRGLECASRCKRWEERNVGAD